MREYGLEVRHEEFDDDHRNVGYRYAISLPALAAVLDANESITLRSFGRHGSLAGVNRRRRAQAAAQSARPVTVARSPHVLGSGDDFTAPAGCVFAGRRVVALKDLSNDLQTVAIWVLHPGKDDMRTIALSMESFTKSAGSMGRAVREPDAQCGR